MKTSPTNSHTTLHNSGGVVVQWMGETWYAPQSGYFWGLQGQGVGVKGVGDRPMYVYSIPSVGPRRAYLGNDPQVGAGATAKYMRIQLSPDGSARAPVAFAVPGMEVGWGSILTAAPVNGAISCPAYYISGGDFESNLQATVGLTGPFLELVPPEERSDNHSCYSCYRLVVKLSRNKKSTVVGVPVVGSGTPRDARRTSDTALRHLGDSARELMPAHMTRHAAPPVLLYLYSGGGTSATVFAGRQLSLPSEDERWAAFAGGLCSLHHKCSACSNAESDAAQNTKIAGPGLKIAGPGLKSATASSSGLSSTTYAGLAVVAVGLAGLAVLAVWGALAGMVGKPQKLLSKNGLIGEPQVPAKINPALVNAVPILKPMQQPDKVIKYGKYTLQGAIGILFLVILYEVRALVAQLNDMVPKIDRAMTMFTPIIPKVERLVDDIVPMVPRIENILSTVNREVDTASRVMDRVTTTVDAVDAVEEFVSLF